MRHLYLILVLIILTACASRAPEPAQPAILASPILKPFTKTPTSAQLPAAPDSSQTGLVITGRVTFYGVGIGDVKIHHSFAAYPGELTATTDSEGYYQSDFIFIPGDEMVTIWAEYEGCTFDPANEYWRHYHGFEERELNFAAIAVISTP
ncbi:MAG: hypothetical protein HZB19_10825 [Chloroflexi bacterium]|nr:hypothetical protein [Chloroflexota bacterium]